MCSSLKFSTAELEKCPTKEPNTALLPFDVNRGSNEMIRDDKDADDGVNNGPSAGAIVGIAVGCTAVVTLIMAITFLVSPVNSF